MKNMVCAKYCTLSQYLPKMQIFYSTFPSTDDFYTGKKNNEKLKNI